jgi:hypothetical protein
VTSNDDRSPGGLSRRELLGRGVKLGGAVLWMTPVVQTFGMGRAFAAEPSGKCLVYCVKYEVDEGRWVALGNGKGNCFDCPPDAINGLPPGFSNATVRRGDGGTLEVELPHGCTVWSSTETGTGDEMTGHRTISVKCGSLKQGAEACSIQTVDDPSRFTVRPCSNGKGISHFEFLVKCCP